MVEAWLPTEVAEGDGEGRYLLELCICAVVLGEKGPLLLEDVLEMLEEEERVEYGETTLGGERDLRCSDM